MKRIIVTSAILVLAFGIISFYPPRDLKAITSLINKSVGNESNLVEGGRHLVALSYGISLVYLDGKPSETKIHWCGSKDNGLTWNHISPRLCNVTAGYERYPAIDANADGSYVAYTKIVNGESTGYVAHLTDPFKNANDFKVFGPLTSPKGYSKYSFISASKASSSVVYGWTNMPSGEICVGVSLDGKTFPQTKVLTIDKGAVSGPAVSIEDQYVALTYQSTSAKFAPDGIDNTGGSLKKSFPVWMESVDGGKTWSEPRPLLGKKAGAFPKIEATRIGKNSQVVKESMDAAGGTNLNSMVSSGLVWAAADINNPLVFMMSTQSVVNKGNVFDKAVTDRNNIGVVSFKPSHEGGTWTHVVSNKGIIQDDSKNTVRISLNHKYSALPKTKVRAVTYLEKVKTGSSETVNNIVIIVSVNSGKSFDHPFTFKASDLGLQQNDGFAFDVSPCLRADQNGDVWADMEYSKTSEGKVGSGLFHASLPVGVNVKNAVVMVATNPKASW